jgi:selenocysteine lyase/cysteine desulfurase
VEQPGVAHALTLALREFRVAAVAGVTVKTPMAEELSAGLVCAEVASMTPPEVVDRLREEHQVIASVTPYATSYLRFGPSIANTEEDVDRALQAVTEIAS